MSGHSSSNSSPPIRLTKSKHPRRRSKPKPVSSSRPTLYSSHRKPKILRYATRKLLEANTPKLIEYIYAHQDQEAFRDPEIRVGLCIKLLHSLGQQYDEEVLRPILDDLEYLSSSEAYLEATGDPKARQECLEDELYLIQRYLKLDDTISLNTEPESLASPFPFSGATSSQLDEEDNESCVIM